MKSKWMIFRIKKGRPIKQEGTEHLQKLIWETLEEEESWRFEGWNSELSMPQKLVEIHTALLENQKEHTKIRTCHVELEETKLQSSYAHELSVEDLKLRIGKKT